MATIAANSHKAGDSFTRLFPIPTVFGDGYFVGWTMRSQVRDEQQNLVNEVALEWLDPVTTRNLKLRVADTKHWAALIPLDGEPFARVFIDIQFTRDSDDEVVSTTTAELLVIRDNTE